ncbi:hypothetical protein PGTUg99_000169 [Puccinia graminis f. sp. tritici]|nr:hypothetical protein PGTUg99_000169 [Puccinia graminis f. sp. tritici]
MSITDQGYQNEKAREVREGFPQCRCSNCMPMEANTFIENMNLMTVDNVDRMITTDMNVYETGASVLKLPKPKTRAPRVSKKRALAYPEDLRIYKKRMRETVDQLHQDEHGENAFFTGSQLFQDKKIDLIAHHADNLRSIKDIRVLIGGETIKGQLDALLDLTHTFQLRQKPVAIPKKTGSSLRADAATEALVNRSQKDGPGGFAPRRSVRKKLD